MYILRKVTVIALVAVLGFSPILSPIKPTQVFAATLQEQLEAIEAELAIIKNERKKLQSQVDSANNQIGSYSGKIGKLRADVENLQLDIAEMELKIKELVVGIDTLSGEITRKQEAIEEKLSKIDVLEEVSLDRITEGYMDYRTRRKNKIDIVAPADINSYFKDSQYRQRLQNITTKAMVELIDLKQELQRDQVILEEEAIAVKRDKAIVDENKTQLDKKQKELEGEIDKYYSAIYATQGSIAGVRSELDSVSDAEARTQGEAERIRQQIFNSFNSLPSGTFVVKGTMIGRQGSTGRSTGPHVHFITYWNGAQKNPCGYVPSGRFGNCGGNGMLPYPLQGTFYFTSGYGNRCISSLGYCSFHNGIDIAHGTWNAPVFATHDGYLSKGVDQFGGLYIIICQDRNNCNNGWKTGYWHFSSY